MKSIAAVINGRLESTRVPEKLVRPFAGTSLLDIALSKLDQMEFVQRRYLAVAEAMLMEMAKPYTRVEVLERSKDAVKKGVNPQRVTFAHYLRVPSDFILVFNPCLPFLTVRTVRKAVDYFKVTEYPSYTSVVPTGDWIFDEHGNPVTNTDPQNLTTNKSTTFYRAAHAFHIVNRRFFETHGYHWTFTKNDPHLVEIPDAEAIDVDTDVEFALAEALYERRHGPVVARRG